MPKYVISVTEILKYSFIMDEPNMESALFLFQSSNKPYPSQRINEHAESKINIKDVD